MGLKLKGIRSNIAANTLGIHILTISNYYMTYYSYPEGDGAPDKNICTSGNPNIPMGYRGDVGLVGAPTPIRLATLKNLYGLPGPQCVII